MDDEWKEYESLQLRHETCTVLEGLSNTTVHIGEEERPGRDQKRAPPCVRIVSRRRFHKSSPSVAYPGIFFGGGDSTNSVEDRGRKERTGIWGRSLLVKGSGGSRNLVQEISFNIVKFS